MYSISLVQKITENKRLRNDHKKKLNEASDWMGLQYLKKCGEHGGRSPHNQTVNTHQICTTTLTAYTTIANTAAVSVCVHGCMRVSVYMNQRLARSKSNNLDVSDNRYTVSVIVCFCSLPCRASLYKSFEQNQNEAFIDRIDIRPVCACVCVFVFSSVHGK